LLINDINLVKKDEDVEKYISGRVNEEINEQQRQYILRQKLDAIKKELGELEGKTNEMQKYLEKLEKEPYPEHIKQRLREEIGRYETMSPSSSESNVLRSYIETLMKLP
jgi:ATP-dependent Lon protease